LRSGERAVRERVAAPFAAPRTVQRALIGNTALTVVPAEPLLELTTPYTTADDVLVKQFQRSQGLKDDGTVRLQTWQEWGANLRILVAAASLSHDL
jgi:murein L,D-transpeptidase YcbB/YkuD